MKRILKIKNTEIKKPSSTEFRRLLNQFKRDVNNSKFQDELTDYLDKIVLDNDVPQFDRRLLIAGLRNKLWAAKGLDTTLLAQEFNYMLNIEKAQMQGARVINLAGNSSCPLIGWGNVPDGNTYGN